MLARSMYKCLHFDLSKGARILKSCSRWGKTERTISSMVNSPVLCTPSSPFNATLNRNCCHKYNGTTYPNGFLQSPHMFLVPFVALEIADRDRKKKKITTFFLFVNHGILPMRFNNVRIGFDGRPCSVLSICPVKWSNLAPTSNNLGSRRDESFKNISTNSPLSPFGLVFYASD